MDETYIELPARFNLAVELLDRHLREGRADRIAIHYLDRVLTYGEVSALANRFGNALLSLGVRMEERVILLLPDSPHFVAGILGTIKIGAVAIPTNTMLKPADYRYILNDCRARVAVVDAELVPAIQAVKDELEFLRHLVVYGGDAPPDCIALDRLLEEASPELAAAPTSVDDAAFWQYSSGTTGQPKGVIHLHHDMIYSADLFARGVLGITEHDRTFSVARLFFGYGMGNGFCFAFRVGASTILTPHRPTAAHVLEVVDRYRPTLFFGVPTSYAAMLEVPGAEERYDWSSVRQCVSAGEALPAPVWERWRDRFGLELIDGLGSTEALHIFLCNRPGDIVPGSLGRPVPGYEARLVDDDGQPVATGQTGTLLIKGDSIAAGYWNKHHQTVTTFVGEWLSTGDKLVRDEQGRFWFEGRGDDMIKAGGIWVSPIEVESALGQHPAVLEAAVIGRADPDGLTKPKGFVVLREGSQPTPELAEEIKLFVKGRIAPYKFPRWIEFVDELPRTPTGKLQRFVLRQLDGA